MRDNRRRQFAGPRDPPPDRPGGRGALHRRTAAGGPLRPQCRVRAAQAGLVAFIDDDCVPDPRWLKTLVAGFRDRSVGGAPGAILPLEVRTAAQRLLEARGGFNRGFERKIYSADGPEAESLCLPLHAWQCGSGANMAFRKSVLDEIGGFDEVLPTAEDIDAFFRVMREGYLLVYEPTAVVRHDHPGDVRQLKRRHASPGGTGTSVTCSASR